MKIKSLLSCLLFLLSFSVFSQTQKGTWLLKGTGEIGQYGEYQAKIRQISIRPSAGYFFAKNIVLGLDLPFWSQSNGGTFAGYQRDFGAAPYMRFYWFKGRFKMFAQVDYYLGWEWRKVIGFSPDTPTRTFIKVNNFKTAASGKIGMSLFLNNQVSLTAHYTGYFHDDRVNIWFNGEKFKGIDFGIDYFFNKKETKNSKDLLPLVDRFLKRGSYQIGLDINVDFNTYAQGNWFWDIFLTDKLLLSNQFETFLVRKNSFVKRQFFIAYEPQFQYFVPLRKTTFIKPFVSGSFGVSNIKQYDGDVNIDGYGYFLAGGLALTQFLNNGKVDFGIECRRYYDDRRYQGKKKWDADAFLKMQFFLSSNISMSVEVRTNVEGVARKAFFEPEQFGMADYLRLGFQYFVEKKNY